MQLFVYLSVLHSKLIKINSIEFGVFGYLHKFIKKIILCSKMSNKKDHVKLVKVRCSNLSLILHKMGIKIIRLFSQIMI